MPTLTSSFVLSQAGELISSAEKYEEELRLVEARAATARQEADRQAGDLDAARRAAAAANEEFEKARFVPTALP